MIERAGSRYVFSCLSSMGNSKLASFANVLPAKLCLLVVGADKKLAVGYRYTSSLKNSVSQHFVTYICIDCNFMLRSYLAKQDDKETKTSHAKITGDN